MRAVSSQMPIKSVPMIVGFCRFLLALIQIMRPHRRIERGVQRCVGSLDGSNDAHYTDQGLPILLFGCSPGVVQPIATS